MRCARQLPARHASQRPQTPLAWLPRRAAGRPARSHPSCQCKHTGSARATLQAPRSITSNCTAARPVSPVARVFKGVCRDRHQHAAAVGVAALEGNHHLAAASGSSGSSSGSKQHSGSNRWQRVKLVSLARSPAVRCGSTCRESRSCARALLASSSRAQQPRPAAGAPPCLP